MPTYEYRCRRCEAVQEVRSKIADKPATVPCACGAWADPILSPTPTTFRFADQRANKK